MQPTRSVNDMIPWLNHLFSGATCSRDSDDDLALAELFDGVALGLTAQLSTLRKAPAPHDQALINDINASIVNLRGRAARFRARAAWYNAIQ